MAEQVFREESFDYTRKLELIKDCIHGVDIQPVAIQISKLRFFLSLVIEQQRRDPHPPAAESRNKIRLRQYASGSPAADRLGTFPAPD